MKYTTVLVLLTLCLVSTIVSSAVPTEAEFQAAFNSWKEAFGITYDSNENQQRYQNWKENMLKIGEFNAANARPDASVSVPDSNLVVRSEDGVEYTYAAEPVVTYPGIDSPQLSANQYTGMTNAEFTAQFTGADSSMIASAVAAAAVLSTGAIVGIAVGGTAAVAGAVGGTVYAVKKRRANRSTKTDGVEIKEISSPQAGSGKTNIYNFDKPHHSITARLFGGK
ncbi:hypothetical protein DLAC_09352 [Tieghemostelium lacteum]|uniref:Cathepsin propeptide inhibitor domain-containing protein n=1 Tax=Tieghemostelium lacteum TaxID=361077 RepID=A0A151Z9T7_TIELA|nr:hypothetical protein DLAC_09352 [Tieghemostelium lacteum]|eukprot:KYQ90717.1 hypothetical protein DLAC_09352 [Tieghemostelium lacteum]